MATVLVTNMPFWAERIGVPRTLAVEFPFGQILGQPNNPKMQMRVIMSALDVLAQADGPGTISHFQEPWPVPFEQALAECHPEVPPPIMGHMGSHIGSFLRAMRRGKK